MVSSAKYTFNEKNNSNNNKIIIKIMTPYFHNRLSYDLPTDHEGAEG
jgi:hypothetical protein